MDADGGVAVAPLVEERQFELQRGPAVALDHYPAAGLQHRRNCLRELPTEPGCEPVGGIQQNQIVRTPARLRVAEERAGVGAPYLAAQIEGLEVAPHGANRGRCGVDEGSLDRAARERLEPER